MLDPRQQFVSERTENLCDAQAAVLGCGSVGGFAAWCLASAGVGRIVLADREALATQNLRRHACRAGDVDRSKAEALANLLSLQLADLDLQFETFCFLREPARLRRIIERSEIVLVAVDAEGPKHLIDAMCWELSRPAVYAGVYGGGWGAEVVLVDLALGTPCYACSARALGRIGVELNLPETNPFYALPGDARNPSDWLRADLTGIMPAATLAATVVKASLAARRGNDRMLCELRNLRSSAALTGADPEDTEILDELEPQALPSAIAASAWRFALREVEGWQMPPWTLDRVSVSPQPECPQCGPRRKDHDPARLSDLLGGAM